MTMRPITDPVTGATVPAFRVIARRQINGFEPHTTAAAAPAPSIKPRWTAAEIAYMLAHYPNTTNRDIAAKLGRTLGEVKQKGRHMGLKKSAEFFASEASGRARKVRA